MVKLVYLARLRESLGVAAEDIALPDGEGAGEGQGVCDVAGLRQWLCSRGETWASEFAPGRPVRAAVNHALAEGQTAIADGDEVAFFPPVTGG